MDITEFNKDYYFTKEVINQSMFQRVVIIVDAIRRSDGKVAGSLKYELNYNETNEMIRNMNNSNWFKVDWDYFINKAIRALLDVISKSIGIDGFFPMDENHYPNPQEFFNK